MWHGTKKWTGSAYLVYINHMEHGSTSHLIKVTFNLSKEDHALIEKTQIITGAYTKSEVIRAALRTYAATAGSSI